MYFYSMNFSEQHKGIQIDLRQIQEKGLGKKEKNFSFHDIMNSNYRI
jgi:hypothetical protein